MKEITFKRLLRWILASLIVVVAVAYGFGVGIASAEQGTIHISDLRILPDYTSGSVYASQTPNFAHLAFDSGNYNVIHSFHVHIPGSYVHSFESTAFTISTGGTGGGIAWYDRNWSAVYYAFDSGDTFTSADIQLSFTKDIFANISITMTGAFCACDANHPVMIRAIVVPGVCVSANHHSVKVATEGTDSYIVRYLSNGLFSVSVDKNPSLLTKYIIHGETQVYSTETTFNSNDFVNATFSYADGLWLNVTLVSGLYENVLVNVTGVSEGWTEGLAPTPVINPITGAGIIFDRTDYAVGDISNISWARTPGSVPLLCTDYIRRGYPDGSKTTIITSPGDAGYTKEALNNIGTHTVYFERECILQSLRLLSSDTANVNPDGNSYILAKSPQGAGISFNVTYSFGYTPIVQGELNSVVVEKLTGDKWEWNNAFSLNNTNIIKGVEYNKSITVGDIGKYKIKLFELSRGYVASVIIDSIAVDIPIIKNISVSRIEVDKVEYLRSDPIDIYYAIDNYNYSNYYSKYISVVHSSGNYPETSHILVTEQEKTTYYASSSAILQNARTGLNYVQLRAKNSTADILLTNTSFNISFIDTEGYGLYIADAEICKGESIVIRYATAPGNNTLRVNTFGDVDVFPVKYYEQKINGSGSISLKLTKISDYQILIYETNVGNVKKFTTAKATDCSTTDNGTEENWGNGGNSYTCGFWDGWVGNLAGSQGINDLTRFEFALVVIGMITIFAAVITKNPGIGIITGFFPYAFFVFISLSTPCGQYMPVWTAVFIALIVGIKMRWF